MSALPSPMTTNERQAVEELLALIRNRVVAQVGQLDALLKAIGQLDITCDVDVVALTDIGTGLTFLVGDTLETAAAEVSAAMEDATREART